MSFKEDRIQYLTAKAQRGVITPTERAELARLLGRNPFDFETPEGMNTLVSIALFAIAIAIIAGILSKNK
jgi:hypothetical protein